MGNDKIYRTRFRIHRTMILGIKTSILVGSVLLSLLGIALICVGFHAVDNAHNMLNLEYRYNMTLCDITTKGRCLDPSEAYMLGIDQVQSGIFSLMIGLIIFGGYATEYQLYLDRWLKR